MIVRPVIPDGFGPIAYWERIGADSLRVDWTNGLAGVRLYLEIDTDSLHGAVLGFFILGPRHITRRLEAGPSGVIDPGAVHVYC